MSTKIGDVVVVGSLRPLGFHQYTNLGAAVDLTDGGTYEIPEGAHEIRINVTTQNVRWRDFPRVDGVTTPPTATIGMQITAGSDEEYRGRLDWIEFIEEVAGAVLNISFYGL